MILSLFWLGIIFSISASFIAIYALNFDKSTFSVVNPVVIYSGLSILFFCIRPAYIYMTGSEFQGAEVIPVGYSQIKLLSIAVWLNFFGSIAFYFGFFSKSTSFIAKAVPYFRVNVSWGVRSLFLVTIIILIAIYILYVYIRFSGFPAIDNFERRLTVENNLDKVMFIIILSGNVFFALSWYFWRIESSRKLWFLSLFLLVSISLVFLQYLMGSRTRLFVLAIVYIALFDLLVKRIPFVYFSILTILILCFAFFVFPLIQVFLSSGEADRTLSELFSRILLQRNGDKIDNFAVIISSIDKHGYLWGGTIFGFLSSLVPALDNMSAPTIHETRLFVYRFFPDIFERGVGYPVPLVANGYWNFGILGSGIFLYFAGLFYGVFFRYAEQNKGLAAVMYAAFCFSMYEVVFGSLANGIARNVMVALVALFLAWVLSGGRAYRAR